MASNVNQSLEELKELDGFLAAAIAHSKSGMALGSLGGGSDFNIEVAVAANSDVIKAKLRAMKSLNIEEVISDILITLPSQYHLIRPMQSNPAIFMYLVLESERSNLALARFRLADVESRLTI